MWPDTISLAVEAQMLLRLLLATGLGALVGYERERAGKAPIVWSVWGGAVYSSVAVWF